MAATPTPYGALKLYSSNPLALTHKNVAATPTPYGALKQKFDTMIFVNIHVAATPTPYGALKHEDHYTV